jgi:hypothetical protein
MWLTYWNPKGERMTIAGTAGRVRPIAALVIAGLVAAPAVGRAAGTDAAPRADAAPRRDGAWLASANRIASTEAFRVQPPASAAKPADDRCGASMAEKLASLWLLGSGSVLLIYGPREKDAGHWYSDSKAEGAAGAVSIAFAVALLHDIRKQRAACAP